MQKQRYIAHGIILATINTIRKYAHYKAQHLIHLCMHTL